MKNKQKKILVVFGTRPEAIKMVSVIDQLRQSDRMDVKVCVTGQHRTMLDQVLTLFNVKPEFDLDLMKNNQDLTDITTNILVGLRNILKTWKPDWVLVHGDTTTTVAAALAAYYEKISIGHIEAGLRTRNIYSPWPEEANRQIVSVLATVHFSPTDSAKQNLLEEGVPEKSIIVTGNTVIDTLFNTVETINKEFDIQNRLNKQFSYLDKNKKLILVTSHRRENFGEGIIKICKSLIELSKNKSLQIIYPVHLNPQIQRPVNELLEGIDNIFLIPPQEYLNFVYLMTMAYIVLTDSGGIQEEAPSIGKPVLVMREETERPEALMAGTVKLVGSETEKIIKEVQLLLNDEKEYKRMSQAHNPYGDGKAAIRVRNHLHDLIINSRSEI